MKNIPIKTEIIAGRTKAVISSLLFFSPKAFAEYPDVLTRKKPNNQ